MAVAVSVVVATYNSGPSLDGMIQSVRRQTIGLDRLELILVDDGSTDGTGERIAQLAAREPWIVARQIANSGWPSRPRNVGISLARGEFIMFVDHDDELFPEALERMAAAGLASSSDMVLGKEVRTGGRTQGLDTFRRNVARADVVADNILLLHTPHRMWRTGFLRKHGVAFTERLRRLEDHKIIADTIEHDPVVTVVADYPCYRWIIHGDNQSLRLPDPVEYFDALRQVLDTVDRWPQGKALQDEGRLMWLRTTVLDRFGANGLRTWPSEYQRRFFDQARAITLERFPVSLDARLPALYRVRAELLRAGDLKGILAYVEDDRHVTTRPRVHETAGEPGAARLTVVARLEAATGPVLFRRSPDGLVQQKPSGALPHGIAARVLDVTEELAVARSELVISHRDTNTEWFLPTTWSTALTQDDDGLALTITAEGRLEPAQAQLGSPLTPGIWDLRLRTLALGYDSRPTVAVEPALLPAAIAFGDHVATPYVTRSGRLAVKVTPIDEERRGIKPTPTRRVSASARAHRMVNRLRNQLRMMGPETWLR